MTRRAKQLLALIDIECQQGAIWSTRPAGQGAMSHKFCERVTIPMDGACAAAGFPVSPLLYPGMIADLFPSAYKSQ